MKFIQNFVLISLGALVAILPAALVSADDAPAPQGPPASGDGNRPYQPSPPQGPGNWHHNCPPCPPFPPPPPPPQTTQVLYGLCGGKYYTGTTQCPKGAYCRKFSDWYSQCNPIGQ